MLSTGIRILCCAVAVANAAMTGPVAAQSKTEPLPSRVSAALRAKAIETAAGKVLIDYQKYTGRLSPADRLTLNCRGARVFEKRAMLVWASIGEVAGESRELREARTRLTENVGIICKGGASPKLRDAATPLRMAMQAANRILTNGTIARSDSDLILFSLADKITSFDHLCAPELESMTPERLIGMSDSQFERELPSIAYGRCVSGSKLGAASAFERLQQPTGYAQCVSEALRETYRTSTECNPVSDEDQLARIRDELAAARAANNQEEVSRLEEEEAQQIEHERQVAEASRDRANSLGGAGQGAMIVGAGLVVLGFAETFGTAGLGAPVGLPTMAAGVALFCGGMAATGVAGHEVSDIERNLAQRGVPSPRLCPGFESALGPLAFAREDGSGRGNTARPPPRESSTAIRPRRNGFGLERMTVFDVMHECHCKNDPMNAIPGMGSRCNAAEKLACLREKDDDVARTGRFNPRCYRLLMEDNPERISQQLQECQVTQCPEGQMIGTDCRCHAVGRTLRFDPRGNVPISPLCGTVRCPEGQVPSGPTCVCRSRDAGPEPVPLPLPQGPGAGPPPTPTPLPLPGR